MKFIKALRVSHEDHEDARTRRLFFIFKTVRIIKIRRTKLPF